MPRSLNIIAEEIAKEIASGNWSQRAAYYAIPYLTAMRTLGSIHDQYGLDSGESIVLYFLSNAGTWRGEVARRVKAELKDIVRGDFD